MPTTEEILSSLQKQAAPGPNTTDALNQLREVTKVPVRVGELTGVVPFKQAKGPGPVFDPDSYSSTVARLIFDYPGEKITQRELQQPPQPFAGGTVSKTLQGQRYQKQQEIETQLRNMGLRDLDISNLLILKRVQKERIKIGAAAGATIASLILGQIPPFTASPVEEVGALAAFGRVAGLTIAAGTGGAAGKTIEDAIDPDTDISWKASLGAGLEEAIFEALTFGLSYGARRLFGKERILSPEAIEDLRRTLREATKKAGYRNVDFLPRQLTERSRAELASQIIETSLGTKTVVRRGQAIARKSLVKAVENLPDRLAMGASIVGPYQSADLIVQAGRKNLRYWRKIGNELFNIAKVNMRGAPIKVKHSKGIAQFFADISEEAGEVAKRELKRIAENVADEVDFDTAQRMRSWLARIERQAGNKLTNFNATTVSRAGVLRKSVDESIQIAANKVGPDAAASVFQARKYWRQGAEVFYDRLSRSVLVNGRRDPKVALAFIKPDNLERIRISKRFLGDKGFDQLRRSWMQGLILQSGAVNPNVLKGTEPIGGAILEKFNSVGDDVLRAMYKPGEIKIIRNNLRALDIVQEIKGIGPGAIVFNSAQLLSLAGLIPTAFNIGPESLQSAGLGFTGFMLVGPAVLATMLKTPGLKRILIQGASLPAGSRESAAVIGRYAKQVYKARKQLNKEEREMQIELERRIRMLEARPPIQPTPKQLRGFGGRGF